MRNIIINKFILFIALITCLLNVNLVFAGTPIDSECPVSGARVVYKNGNDVMEHDLAFYLEDEKRTNAYIQSREAVGGYNDLSSNVKTTVQEIDELTYSLTDFLEQGEKDKEASYEEKSALKAMKHGIKKWHRDNPLQTQEKLRNLSSDSDLAGNLSSYEDKYLWLPKIIWGGYYKDHESGKLAEHFLKLKQDEKYGYDYTFSNTFSAKTAGDHFSRNLSHLKGKASKFNNVHTTLLNLIKKCDELPERYNKLAKSYQSLVKEYKDDVLIPAIKDKYTQGRTLLANSKLASANESITVKEGEAIVAEIVENINNGIYGDLLYELLEDKGLHYSQRAHKNKVREAAERIVFNSEKKSVRGDIKELFDAKYSVSLDRFFSSMDSEDDLADAIYAVYGGSSESLKSKTNAFIRKYAPDHNIEELYDHPDMLRQTIDKFVFQELRKYLPNDKRVIEIEYSHNSDSPITINDIVSSVTGEGQPGFAANSSSELKELLQKETTGYKKKIILRDNAKLKLDKHLHLDKLVISDNSEIIIPSHINDGEEIDLDIGVLEVMEGKTCISGIGRMRIGKIITHGNAKVINAPGNSIGVNEVITEYYDLSKIETHVEIKNKVADEQSADLVKVKGGRIITTNGSVTFLPEDGKVERLKSGQRYTIMQTEDFHGKEGHGINDEVNSISVTNKTGDDLSTFEFIKNNNKLDVITKSNINSILRSDKAKVIGRNIDDISADLEDNTGELGVIYNEIRDNYFTESQKTDESERLAGRSKVASDATSTLDAIYPAHMSDVLMVSAGFNKEAQNTLAKRSYKLRSKNYKPKKEVYTRSIKPLKKNSISFSKDTRLAKLEGTSRAYVKPVSNKQTTSKNSVFGNAKNSIVFSKNEKTDDKIDNKIIVNKQKNFRQKNNSNIKKDNVSFFENTDFGFFVDGKMTMQGKGESKSAKPLTFSAGVDYTMNDSMYLGGFGLYDKKVLSGPLHSVTATGTALGAYLDLGLEELYLSGYAAYSFVDYDITRNLYKVLGIDKPITAKAKGYTIIAGLLGEMSYTVGKLTVNPFISSDFTYASIQPFTEKSDTTLRMSYGQALNYSEANIKAGAKAYYKIDMGMGSFIPKIGAALNYKLYQDASNIDGVHFVDFKKTFDLDGKALLGDIDSPLTIDLDAELVFAMNNGLSVYATAAIPFDISKKKNSSQTSILSHSQFGVGARFEI